VKFLGSYPRHAQQTLIVDATISNDPDVDPDIWLAKLRERGN
jgi:hypothetical protein